MLSDKAEEILETLWLEEEEKKSASTDLKQLNIDKDTPLLKELSGLITVTKDYKVSLTPKGKEKGRDVVRRHRLAERLLTDVLDIKHQILHETACKFEHLLHKDVGDNICILLGHPKVCPHGHPIPTGECCKKKKTAVMKVVSSLSELSPGQQGTIAYLQANEPEKLQKIMAMGILPGMHIELIQAFPSFLFKVENSQFAVDESIASELFVRIKK